MENSAIPLLPPPIPPLIEPKLRGKLCTKHRGSGGEQEGMVAGFMELCSKYLGSPRLRTAEGKAGTILFDSLHPPSQHNTMVTN